MSHLAGPHSTHSRQTLHRSNPRDLMAIGFLAPQHTDPPQHQPRHVPARQDTRTTPASRPQLEAFAYGVNVEASMSRPPRNLLPITPPNSVPSKHQQRRPHITSPTTPSFEHTRFDDLERAPRERRDPYSEEMQFFIMYARIIREHDWRKIEDDFEHIFRQRRPRDGLTAVYYRIRNKWGMQQVLKSGPDKYQSDIGIVDARARGLPRQFLQEVGYMG